MRLNFTPALQINNLFQSYQINRSAANKPGGREAAASGEERRDTLTLSPMGQRQNMITSLMKQKMEITDRKNALMASVKEKGGSMDSIKSQLEAYDEQLQNIDIQISEAMSRELEKQEEEKKSDNEEPMTREEFLNKRMNDVAVMSNDAQHVDLLDSVKTKVDGRIKVLESEISLDNGRAGDGGTGASAFKKEELSELKKKSAELSADIGSRMVDIAEDVEEDREKRPVSDSAEDEDDTADTSEE